MVRATTNLVGIGFRSNTGSLIWRLYIHNKQQECLMYLIQYPNNWPTAVTKMVEHAALLGLRF